MMDQQTILHREQQKARQRLQSASEGDDVMASMVKMVAERVYFHMKLEFHNADDKQNLSRVKKSLLQATDDVMTRVTEKYRVNLRDNTTTKDKDTEKKEPAPSLQYVIIPLLLPKYLLHFVDNAPKSIFSFSILNSKENVKKGIIVDGEYITYEISTMKACIEKSYVNSQAIPSSRVQQPNASVYHVERRSSEMKKLHTHLHKVYQNMIVPPFPSKILTLQKDTLIEHRKRVFSLWLGYIANDSIMQHDNDVISFISGVSSSVNEWPHGDSAAVASPQAIADTMKFIRFYTGSGDKQRNISNSSNEIQVLRDIHAIKRDVKRLQSDSNQAIDACRSVLHSFNRLQTSIRAVQQDMLSLDGLDASDAPLSQILSSGLALADDRAHQISSMLTLHFFDPLSFFYDSLLPYTTEICEKVSKQMPSHLAAQPATPLLVDEHSPFCDDDEDSVPFRKSVVGNSTAGNARSENMRQAVTFIRSYDYGSRFRSFTMFRNLRDLASSMIQQHADAQTYWGSLKRDASKIFSEDSRESIHQESNAQPNLSKRSDGKNQNANKGTWSYVRTFLDRPIIPTGTRKPPATQRYSNRNHGTSNGNTAANGAVAQNAERPARSAASANSSTAQTNVGSGAAAKPAAAVRKMHRPNTAAAAAGKGSTGDFFVKAPTPAPTLSANAAPTLSSSASNIPAAPPFVFDREASFTSRAYAMDPGLSVPADDLPDPASASAPAPSTSTSSSSKQHTPKTNSNTNTNTTTASTSSKNANNTTGKYTKENESASQPAAVPTAASVPVIPTELPEGWQASFTDDGRVYYYNIHTRVSRWDAPTEEVAAAVRDRVLKTRGVVDEAVQRRRQEIKEQHQQEEATKQAAAAVRPEIQRAIQLWRRPKTWSRDRDVGELLSSLHTIVCSVTAEMVVGDKALTAQSSPSDIKKAYLKAARHIHPDKFTADMVLEERLIAEEVFVVLTEEYNAYKKAHDLV